MSLSWMYCIPGNWRCIVSTYLTMLQTNIGGTNEMVVHQHEYYMQWKSAMLIHLLVHWDPDNSTSGIIGKQIVSENLLKMHAQDIHSRFLFKMSTQDVYSRCPLKVSTQDVYSRYKMLTINIGWLKPWAYYVMQKQCKQEHYTSVVKLKPSTLTSPFCHLSVPQQALCQCELLVLLMNNHRWNHSGSGGQLKFKETGPLLWKSS